MRVFWYQNRDNITKLLVVYSYNGCYTFDGLKIASNFNKSRLKAIPNFRHILPADVMTQLFSVCNVISTALRLITLVNLKLLFLYCISFKKRRGGCILCSYIINNSYLAIFVQSAAKKILETLAWFYPVIHAKSLEIMMITLPLNTYLDFKPIRFRRF